RVAEEIVFGEVSTGASNDFERATSIVHKMITEYGMSEKIGPLQFTSGGGGQVFLGRDIQNEQTYSDSIAQEIDKEMQNFINYCYDRAKRILTENKDKLLLIAQTLLEVETLDEKQIKSLFEDGILTEPELEDENSDVKVNINRKDDESSTPESYEEAKEKAEKKYAEAQEEARKKEEQYLADNKPKHTSDHNDSDEDNKKE